jgi:transcriptional regulator with XRE-family HTH domain
MNPDLKLREIIRARRKEFKLTLEKLAHAVDCTYSHLQNVERGRSVASDKLLVRLAEALKLDIEDLRLRAQSARDNPEPRHARKVEANRGVFPSGVGREPYVLTSEISAAVLDSLRMGGTVTGAARYAGISRELLAKWLRQGESDKGKRQPTAHANLYTEVLKARGQFVIAGASRHHRWGLGGIVEKPKLKIIETGNGSVIRTDEVETDEDGNPVMVKSWIEPDVRAIEWELARLDPESYASPDASRITQINQQSTQIRTNLLDVLKELGTIPDDDFSKE